MNQHPPTPQPTALLTLAAAIVAAGGVIGALLNAINGVVSPEHFRSVLRWGDIEHIWRAVVAQGILAGVFYGVFVATVFTLVVGFVSKARCSFAFARPQLLAMIAGVAGCWIVGGLIGVGLAALSPEFFQRTFIGVPDSFGEMLRYAWVGGSNSGAMTGGVLALSIGCLLFTARWRRFFQLTPGDQ